MTNKEVWETALRQSGYDFGCEGDIFLQSENRVLLSGAQPKARSYLPLPFACDIVSYGSNAVAQGSAELLPIIQNYISRFPVEHLFETPNLHVLDEAIRPYGYKVCFMAEYFLPDVEKLKPLPCPYEMRLLERDEFKGLYLPQWSNAICKERQHLDILCMGAYHEGELIGLAGCSADCEEMWQIGIDVLPQYRRQGVASALTSALAIEVMKRGKVPFYCAAWSNIRSVRNAIRCGFYPAWVEVSARETPYVDKLNGN